MAERRVEVDSIPALVVEPAGSAPSRLVVWLSHLGGSKERVRPQLEALAARGVRAVSFDPPGHGERATGDDPRAGATAVLERFRLRMWPILGQTTLEALRVIDAVRDEGITAVGAGGISMGGDVGIALAGIDRRIDRVAAVGSTPDWTRPGMTRLDDPGASLEQGDPDSYGAWLREQLDPMLHLERYTDGIRMHLHCGAEDHHVPQSNARAFAAALGDRESVQVVTHAGLDHWGVCTDDRALADCLAFLAGDFR